MKTTIVLSALLAIVAAAPSRKHQHHEHKRAVVVTVTEYATSIPRTSSASTLSGSASSSISGISPSTAPSAPASGSSGIQGDLEAFVNPSIPFEDGIHDCSSLPIGQGVVAVDWISGLTGGFSSIMNDQGKTSSTCQHGFYCSYACQAGMSKTQWPSEQPSSGISVGGLYCNNGKLFKSNPNDKYLCSWGKQSANFVSNITQDVSICRTDYPGSENMNIPTLLKAGSSAPVSVIDSETYFTWRGGKTSTQYYVNNAGVPVEEGCIWGTSSSDVGNWAPIVLGAGYTGGNTYLSLIPNPNNKVAANYNIKIVGADGSATVGSCFYEDGVYSGGNSEGCTLTVTSGSGIFVFY